jgi:hypothetical protein
MAVLDWRMIWKVTGLLEGDDGGMMGGALIDGFSQVLIG